MFCSFDTKKEQEEVFELLEELEYSYHGHLTAKEMIENYKFYNFIYINTKEKQLHGNKYFRERYISSERKYTFYTFIKEFEELKTVLNNCNKLGI